MLTIPKEKLPTHIACIMDGNGRWANSRHLPRQAGHRAGADTVERCADFCMAHDIPWLTLYAFSSENWNRPKTEVRALMLLLHEFLKKRLNQMMEKGVRLHAIGDLSRIPARTRKLLQNSLEATSGNTRLNLVLAISYGSRTSRESPDGFMIREWRHNRTVSFVTLRTIPSVHSPFRAKRIFSRTNRLPARWNKSSAPPSSRPAANTIQTTER